MEHLAKAAGGETVSEFTVIMAYNQTWCLKADWCLFVAERHGRGAEMGDACSIIRDLMLAGF